MLIYSFYIAGVLLRQGLCADFSGTLFMHTFHPKFG